MEVFMTKFVRLSCLFICLLGAGISTVGVITWAVTSRWQLGYANGWYSMRPPEFVYIMNTNPWMVTGLLIVCMLASAIALLTALKK